MTANNCEPVYDMVVARRGQRRAADRGVRAPRFVPNDDVERAMEDHRKGCGSPETERRDSGAVLSARHSEDPARHQHVSTRKPTAIEPAMPVVRECCSAPFSPSRDHAADRTEPVFAKEDHDGCPDQCS